MRCTRCDQTASAVCVLSFGYFSLHKQRKVTGCRATPDGFDCDCELDYDYELKLPQMKPLRPKRLPRQAQQHHLN